MRSAPPLRNQGAILLQPDGTAAQVAPEDGRQFQLPELQKFVGGYIEIFPLRMSGRWMVINEEGKLRLQLPFNPAATAIARANGLAPDDYIVGPALVCRSDQID